MSYRIECENFPVPYQSLDENGNILEVNRAWLEELGYNKEDVIDKNFSQFLHPISQGFFKENFSKFKKAGKVKDVEFHMCHKNGRLIEVSFNGCVEYKNNSFKCTHCIFQNITERKNIEREKEFLMRELNHRIKNNLNMVSSLISLKQMSLGDKIDLSDIANQIKTISLVHEKLHQTNEIEYIEFKSYIQDLLMKLFEGKNVVIINNIENLVLKTKVAISLGLIINELATNAIKYGFTEKNREFILKMEKNENYYVLKVSNSGNPFPEDRGLENNGTLGLQLINSLIIQVQGEIELIKNPTTFIIKLPID
ncbi:MAG: PAS domain-containing sensor histidine kinase [Bacillota bacterium]